MSRLEISLHMTVYSQKNSWTKTTLDTKHPSHQRSQLLMRRITDQGIKLLKIKMSKLNQIRSRMKVASKKKKLQRITRKNNMVVKSKDAITMTLL